MRPYCRETFRPPTQPPTHPPASSLSTRPCISSILVFWASNRAVCPGNQLEIWGKQRSLCARGEGRRGAGEQGSRGGGTCIYKDVCLSGRWDG